MAHQHLRRPAAAPHTAQSLRQRRGVHLRRLQRNRRRQRRRLHLRAGGRQRPGRRGVVRHSGLPGHDGAAGAGPHHQPRPGTGRAAGHQRRGQPGGYAPCYYQVPTNGVSASTRSSSTAPAAATQQRRRRLVRRGADERRRLQQRAGDQHRRLGRHRAGQRDFHHGPERAPVRRLPGPVHRRQRRPIYPTVYAATLDGYQYRIDLRGVDPNGFILYGNQIGFLDSDGRTPLYHDILGQDGQVSSPQGGVSLSLPNYPVFFSPPDSAALSADNIPLSAIAPSISGLSFSGNASAATTAAWTAAARSPSRPTSPPSTRSSSAGTASTSTRPARPTASCAASARRARNTVAWDGKDNSGNAFPVGTDYAVHGQHPRRRVPLPDAGRRERPGGRPDLHPAERLQPAGQHDRLLRRPGLPHCRGFYVTYSATAAPASSNNAALVSHVLGGLNPPATPDSNPLTGFDTTAPSAPTATTATPTAATRTSPTSARSATPRAWTSGPTRPAARAARRSTS